MTANADTDTESGSESDGDADSDGRAHTDHTDQTQSADSPGSATRADARTDPHSLGDHDRPGDGDEDHNAFWADDVADAIEARDPDDPIVVKGGVSPSGVPHIGHFNEILRGYFVAEVLRERGHEVRQVFTTDDRDRLRKVPRALATLDGEIVDLGDDRVDAGALGRNLGQPYTDIPDPFGCCDSYGDHFTELLRRSADLVGVPIDVVSNTALYEDGTFDDAVRHVLAHADTARDVLSEYQDKVDESYVPFQAQCESCGNLTEDIRGVDLDAGTVEYVCSDVEAGGQTIQGCGHAGTATFREGKLPWRFEWPAQWQVLGVDHEPFGKDHAEGSWPSGEHIARTVFGFEPPVPMVYEWFTLNGGALSSSEGNIVTVHEVLDLIEPPVFRYFFTKDPKKQRDFDVSRLDQLVDEFDRFERVHFGEDDAPDQERRLAERAYPFTVDAVRPERVRLPYTFAAVLGMTDDAALRETMARRAGHIPDDASDWAVDDALARVENARNWAVRTDNEYNYRLAEDLPDVDVGDDEAAALDALADFIESEAPGDDELQESIYEIAREHDVAVGDFFSLGYQLFLDEAQGPRLGPFLAALERDFVLGRLRREG